MILSVTKTTRFSIQSLRNDDGVAALVIAAAIMVVSGTALSTFLAESASPIARDLAKARSGNVNLDLIHDALTAAALQDSNLLLPCPADPTVTGATFGTATAAVGTDCTTLDRGIVPFQTIGLSESDVRDGEGNYITYLVDDNNVSICNEKYPNTGSLTDQRDSQTYLFALISHGPNRAGAYSEPNNPTGSDPSDNEDDNCITGHPECASPTAQEFRSGPINLEEGSSSYFDDIVMVGDTNRFTTECIDETEDPLLAGDTSSNDRPAGAETSFANSEANDNFNNASDGDRRNASITDEDPDSTPGNGDEFVQVYMRGANAGPRSSCFWNEGAVELDNRVVRAYVEASFDEDTGTGNGDRRGALIMAFLRGDEPIVDSLCGGPDTQLGWEDGASNTLPVEKFGVELDVEGEVNSDAPFEPSYNHLAVIGTNIDHTGDDPADLTDRDGAICDASSDHDDPDTGSDNMTVGDGLADDSIRMTSNMEGCYPNEDEATWLESGTSTFHGFRVELDNTTGNNCGDPAGDELDWIRVNGWVFENGLCTGNCEDLRYDYFGQAPTVSYCLPYNAAVFSTVRYGFTAGIPDLNSPSGVSSEPRIRKFGIRSDVVGTIAKDNATTTSETLQLSSLDFMDETGLTCTGGNANQQADTSIITDDDIVSGGVNQLSPVFTALRGRLACNTEGRMGVAGLSNDEQLTTQTTSLELELWPNLVSREAVQIEFPETVRRYMVHLRDLSDPAHGSATLPDRAIILGYNQDTYVGRQDVVACSAGDDYMVSGSFSGAAIDRLVVLPEPADQTYMDSNEYAELWVDGFKGCGSENICASESLSVDNVAPIGDIQGLTNDCYTSDVDSFALPNAVTANDETPQMDYANDIRVNYTTENAGSWVNLSDHDMNVFVPSGDDVRINNDTDNRGFGVNSAGSDSGAHIESNPEETLTFLFDRAFNKLRLNIARFSENASATNLEVVRVHFLRGSTDIGYADTVACNENDGDGADGARIIEFDTSGIGTAPGAFDRVRVTARPRTGGSTETQVTIREIRACEATGGDCSLSGTATSTCTVDGLGVVTEAVTAGAPP